MNVFSLQTQTPKVREMERKDRQSLNGPAASASIAVAFAGTTRIRLGCDQDATRIAAELPSHWFVGYMRVEG